MKGRRSDVEGLEARAAELERRVQRLEGEASRRIQVEEALRERTHELGERVKELNCLYAISNLVDREGIHLDDVLRGTVKLIPPAWQYPEITCARILLGGRAYETGNFRETPWSQSCDIVVNGERAGAVSVYYLEETPAGSEGPFLREERSLINAIAEQIGLIVERKRAEEALRESEELHRITLSSISDAVFITDDAGRFTYICPNVDVIFGYDFSEVRKLGSIGRLLGDGLFDRNALEARGEIQNIERDISDKHGGNHSLLVNVKRVSIRGGTVLYTCRDITERKAAEEALQRSEKQLSALSKKIISTQEEERARLSHELHDEIGQQLTALRLEIGLLQREYGSVLSAERLRALTAMVEKATAELRRVCRGLRPTVLDDLGVAQALESLVREFEAHGAFEMETATMQVDESGVNPETAISVYRVLQEALTNVTRHSGASRVRVSFRQENSTLVLEVLDNGKGFADPERVGEKGFGILGMKERAALCGGTVEIESGPGRGTRVVMRAPAAGREVESPL
ncbi:MAG: ATP-binding protein [bacterium]